MCDKGKKWNKDYNFWLENEMDDYYLDAPDADDVITSLQTKYDKGKPSKEKSDPHQDQKLAKKNYSRFRNHVKFSESFNFLETFKGLSDAVIIKMSLFLSLKDLALMLTTCKLANERFDQQKCWQERGFRDFTNLRISEFYLKRIQVKQVYRYLHAIETKVEVRYDSKAFEANTLKLGTEIVKPYVSWRKAPPKTPVIPSAELSKTLIDSIAAKTSLVNHYIYQMIPDYYNYSVQDFKGISWQPNLNLSWLERRSGVQLWLGGVNDDKLTSKNLRPIRLFGDEVGQKAYFYEGKYVIIESKLFAKRKNNRKSSAREEEKTGDIAEAKEHPEQEEEEDQLYSVTIADLEEAFKDHCMNSTQYSWRYCFRMRPLGEKNTEGKVEKHTYEQGSVIEVDIPKEDLPEAKVGQTISKEGLRMFFTKNTSSVTLFIFDPKEKDSYFKVSLNLESPLQEAFFTKASDQENLFTVFLIDQAFNIYTVKYSQENGLKTNKISLINPQEEEEEKAKLEENRHGIFKVKKQVHHQFFESAGVEALVLFKGRTFYLVNLKTCQTTAEQIVSNNYGVVYDWTIYCENLYVCMNNEISYYTLNLPAPTISKNSSSGTIFGTNLWRYDNYSRRWISMNPCYTLFAEVTPYFSGQRSLLNASIVSTQQLAKGYSSLGVSFCHNFSVKLENFINLAEYEDRIKEIAENMNVKIEDNTIVLQTSKRAYMVNLEAYRKSGPRFVGQTMTHTTARNFQVLEIPEEEEKKKKDDKKEKKEKPKHVVALNSIHENWNHSLPKNRKQKTDFSGCSKKDDTKEEREQDRVVRQKGDKYYKNVRHDQFEEKVN